MPYQYKSIKSYKDKYFALSYRESRSSAQVANFKFTVTRMLVTDPPTNKGLARSDAIALQSRKAAQDLNAALIPRKPPPQILKTP